jgi:hypothetical protein
MSAKSITAEIKAWLTGATAQAGQAQEGLAKEERAKAERISRDIGFSSVDA